MIREHFGLRRELKDYRARLAASEVSERVAEGVSEFRDRAAAPRRASSDSPWTQPKSYTSV